VPLGAEGQSKSRDQWPHDSETSKRDHPRCHASERFSIPLGNLRATSPEVESLVGLKTRRSMQTTSAVHAIAGA